MSLLSPSAIFSPTLARQALATTKDWNYIDAWLSRHFSPGSAPPFERNSETLKALLALAAVNESADEERDLLSKAEGRSLAELRQLDTLHHHSDLLRNLERNLTRDGKASLDALAETAAILNLPRADVEQMGAQIMELQVTAFSIEQTIYRIAVLHTHLQKELELAISMLHELDGEEYQPSSNLGKQTIDYQRKVKALSAKLPELRERISVLSISESNGSARPTIQDVGTEENKFKTALDRVKDLEAQVKSYHGLPHDTDLARLELENLRVELKALVKERDGMFEGLVERESPKKHRLPRR